MSENSETNQNETQETPENGKTTPDPKGDVSSLSEEDGAVDEAGVDTPPVEGMAWQVAQLATSLLAQSYANSKGFERPSSQTDEYFTHQIRDSVRNARIVLEMAADPGDEETRLSTWFRPNSLMSKTEIEKRLKEIGWKTVGRDTTPSYNTIVSQIETIRARWQSRLDRLKAEAEENYDETVHAADLVAGAVKELCADAFISSELPGLLNAANQFLKTVHEDVLRSANDLRRVDFERNQALFDWCFVQISEPLEDRVERETTEDNETKSSDGSSEELDDEKIESEDVETVEEKSSKSPEAQFRIHELLRFAEDRWELEKSEIGLQSRHGEISGEDEKNQRDQSDHWLPPHFRPRALSELKVQFAMPSQNCPLPDRLSFHSFNSDGCKSPLEHYPFGPK